MPSRVLYFFCRKSGLKYTHCSICIIFVKSHDYTFLGQNSNVFLVWNRCSLLDRNSGANGYLGPGSGPSLCQRKPGTPSPRGGDRSGEAAAASWLGSGGFFCRWQLAKATLLTLEPTWGPAGWGGRSVVGIPCQASSPQGALPLLPLPGRQGPHSREHSKGPGERPALPFACSASGRRGCSGWGDCGGAVSRPGVPGAPQ